MNDVVVPYILKTDGSKVQLPQDPDLETLQEAVGGWIEGVGLKNGGYMYVNENGKFSELPFNEHATKLIDFHDYIVGDVVIITEAE
jgi:hypothetical protein